MKNKLFISMWFIPVIILLIIIAFNTKGGDNMARIKISELNARTEAADNDLIAIVDTINSETKKITKGNLINDVYSTAEVKTNKRWIDGKPIYRKVIDLGDLTDVSRWTDDGILIDFSIDNLDKIVKFDTYGYNSWGTFSLNNYTFHDNNLGVDSTISTIISVVGNFKYIIIKPTISYDIEITTGVTILEYTKTTD